MLPKYSALVAVMIGRLAASAPAATIESRYSPSLWNTWDTWRNHRATQVMRLEPQKDDWPAFALRPYTNTREGDMEGLVLGSIVPGDVTAEPSGLQSSSQNTWTSMAMQYGGGQLTLTLSRLSPAARIDVRGDAVHLFSNLKFERSKGNDKQVVFPRPKHVAFAADGGKVQVQAAPAKIDCAAMSQNWMLFWFGTDTPWRSSRLPMTTGYIWGVPTPQIYFAHVDIPVLVVFQHKPVSIELYTRDAPKPKEAFDWDALVPWGGSYQYRPLKTDVAADRKAGATVRFANDAGTMLVMPLYGNRYYLAPRNGILGDGIPDDVARRCALWGRMLLSFPTGLNESYTVTDDLASVRVNGTVEFARIQDDWRTQAITYAPISQYVKLAADGGAPVRFDHAVADLDYATYAGPVTGVRDAEAYSYTVGGLDRYVWERRELNPVPPDSRPLVDRLGAAMAEAQSQSEWAPMLFAAGKIEPAGAGIDLDFNFPIDTPYHMLPCVPLLPKDNQDQALAYLRNYARRHPPSSATAMPANASQPQRMIYPTAAIYADMANRIPAEKVEGWLPELYYLLGTYGELANRLDERLLADALKAKVLADDARSYDFNIGPLSHPQLFPRRYLQHAEGASNRRLQGLIGLLRCYRRTGNQEQAQKAAICFAQEMLHRIALVKFPVYFYRSGLFTLDGAVELANRKLGKRADGPITSWAMVMAADGNPTLSPKTWAEPAEDIRCVERLEFDGASLAAVVRGQNHGYYLIRFLRLCPEVARLLADTCKDEMSRTIERVNYRVPEWFFTDTPNWEGCYAEALLSPPENAHGIFLARAWMQFPGREDLSKYLDRPWCRADLYYLDKLRAAIEATSGWTWKPGTWGASR